MPVSELSEDRVEDRLQALEEAYASFAVSQTTLSVSPAAYEQAREQCKSGLADVYVQVYNDAEHVLLVEGDGEWAVPHAEPSVGERLEEGTCRALTEQTGVECRITDLERVIILGIRHDEEPERETQYRLVVVFSAAHVAGSPGPLSAWHSDLPESALPNH